MATTAQMGEELHGLRGTQLQAKMSAARNEDGTYNFDALDVEGVNKLNDAITEKATAYETAKSIETMAERNAAAIETGVASKGLVTQPTPGGITMAGGSGIRDFRTLIRDSEGRKEAVRRAGTKAAYSLPMVELTPAEYKTIIALTDINNPATRLPNIITSAQEERTVADLMLQGTTDNNAITFIEETTFTNAATTVAEAGTKPESTLDFTERTVNVRKIATWEPVTDELLSDVAGFDSYLRGRLGFMVQRVEETQLLTGDGNAPNITGILNASTIQTQAKGADPTPDAVFKAMTKVRSTGFAEPTAAVFHPNDWQDIRLLRTADGIYIWGSPADTGPDRIWGLDVRVTTAETENTGLVGAFKPFAQIFRREGISISVSTEHSTYFTENKVAVLAEERLALAIYRGAAFCKITGI
jgi:HK97 family phage major capsid protein